jgi:hypothetical protein
MGIDIQIIDLEKQKENIDYIWYRFKVSDLTDEYAVSSTGRKKSIIKYRYGIIKFQKTGTLEKTTYEILTEETDKKLLLDPAFEHIVWGCLYMLVRCKRNNVYPESMAYQCG